MNHPNLIYNENINNNNNNKPNSSSSSSSRLPQPKHSQPNRIPMNKNKVPTSSMINDNWNHLEHRHQTARHSFRFDESCPTAPVATTTPLVSKLPTNLKKSAINSHFFGLGHQNHPNTKRSPNSNSNHALNLMNSSSGSERSSSPEDGATGDLQSNYPHSNQIHFLLETWLENEFQTNFKQLSRLIRNDRRETAIGSGNNSHYNNNNGSSSSKHQRYSSMDGADRSYLKPKSFHHIVDEDHSLDCSDIEMEPEIFFIRKHDSEDDDIISDRSPGDKGQNNEDDEGWGVDATTTSTPSSGLQLGSNYLHLTNWLLQRRQIGSDGSVTTAVNRHNSKKFPWTKSAAAAAVAPSRDIKNKTKETDTHSKLLSKSRRRKVATVESPVVEIQQPNQNSWLTERLDYIEKCMMKPKRDGATGATSTKNNQSWTMEENLICLVLSKPDDRSNRDSLIYSYPSLGPIDSRSQSESSSTTTSKVSKLAKVSGMFITLYEVMNLLTPSNPFETLQLSTVDILERVLSPAPDGAASQPVSCKYFVSFVIESVKLRSSGDSAIPLMLLLAMPCDKFTELDCRAIAELVSNTLHVRFGSLAAAFSSFFFMSSPNSNNFSLTNSSRYLNRILATFETLLATKLSSTSYFSTLKSSTLKNNTNFIESLLSLSNTFFVPKQSNLGQYSSFHTALVTQQLSVDESTALHLSNYLNDFDSLDWLDESIAFYKDGDDIERSLSEHFARCLQLDSVSSTAALTTTGPSTANNRSPNKSASLFTENSQLFDLLELDLSSFVVIGSCLFYRGLFVQSHLSPIYLNSIRQILFGRGLLAASKHHPYDLVYFSRFYPTEEPSSVPDSHYNSKQGPSELSHQFLLVIGYGHLLHCSLVNVHCFDRFYYRYLSDYRNHDGPQIDPKHSQEQQFPRFSPTTNSSSLQLPSSFAFYVFIKESFRLLCLYLERFEFLTQLSDAFRLGQQVSTSNFVKSFSVATKHSKKKKHHHLVMKKRIKRLKSFLGLSSNNNNNNSHHNESNNHENCDSKNKPLQSPPPPVNIGPDSRSLNQGPRNYGNGQKSRINSTSSQPCSCASDRSSSVSPSSSVDSSTLYSSSNTSSMNSLSTNSIQSVATLDSLSILTCTNNSSIHRFSHDFLPESLICYLSIDLAQQLETFHGPILEAFDLDSFQTEVSTENENQNGGAKMADCADFQQHHSNLMANITSDLCQAIQQLRSTMRKQTLLSLRRRRRGRVGSDSGGPASANTQGQQGTSTTSGRVIKLRYNCAKDSQSSGTTTTTTTTTTSILFRFYLLGRCSIVDSPDQSDTQRIGDEFYACFKLNSVPDSLSSSGKHHRNNNSQRLSRWSFAGFGRNDERLATAAASSRVSDLDGLIVTSKKSSTSLAVDGQEDSSELDSFDETKFLSMDYGGGGAAANNKGHGDRSQHYEQSRLDFLRIDLDELIQSVRLRNWH